MRTSEDTLESGIYTSECCGVELTFMKGGSLRGASRCYDFVPGNSQSPSENGMTLT